MPNSPTGSPAAGAASSNANLGAGVGKGTFREAQSALQKLYRRHQPPVTSGAYARALQAMRGCSGPEGAWSPYLLTMVSRTAAAWPLTARRTELAPGEEGWRSAVCPSAGGPFGHSATKGQSPDGIAALPGLIPSGAASLAARARVGLRAAFTAVATSGARVLSTAPRCRSRPLVDPAIGTRATGMCLTYTGPATDGAPVCRYVPPATPPRPRPWAYLRFDGQTAFTQRDPSPVHRHDGKPLQVAIASIPFRGRCLW